MLLNYYCCIWLIKEGKLLGSGYNWKGGAVYWCSMGPFGLLAHICDCGKNGLSLHYNLGAYPQSLGKLFSAEKEASAFCTAPCNPPHTHTTPLLRQHLIYPRLASNLLCS